MADDLPIKHYLVQRGPDGLERIDVFTDGEQAVEAYNERERQHFLMNEHRDKDVCLFGADSLLTLCRTHAAWLAPETLPELFG